MRIVVFLTALMWASASLGLVNTNTTAITIGDTNGHNFAQFDWDWAGYDDQAVSFGLSRVITNHTWQFKIALQNFTGQVAYVVVSNANITVTTTNITFSIDHTNVPPNNVYQASLRATDSTSGDATDIARGKIHVTDSIYDDADGSFTFPAAVTAADYLTIAAASTIYVPAAGGAFTGGATNTSSQGFVGNGANLTNLIAGSIPATITRDTEWDTLAEINTASTDTDAVLDTDIGVTVQAYDADLDDLADGSLTGSKVGTGIAGDNITDNTIDTSELEANSVNSSNITDGTVGAAELAATAVSAASYTGATITVDADGRLTAASSVAYQPLEATLTDIADGTIAENLVNTANPWADNEVADDITAGDATTLDTLDSLAFVKSDGTVALSGEWDTGGNALSSDNDVIFQIDNARNSADSFIWRDDYTTVLMTLDQTSSGSPAADLTVTGTIKGNVPTASTAINDTWSGNELDGSVVFVSSNTKTQTLGSVAAGDVITIQSIGIYVLKLEIDGSDYVTMDGVQGAADEGVVSAGGAGDTITLVGENSTNWVVVGKAGTWTQTTPP
ncbi:MAG: hypothetical protein O3A47_04130 [Chloroflexi bacterium]|nr:hypothetical protein [Chloroflexota bacterium]